MDVLLKLLFSVLGALTVIIGLSAIAPGFFKQPRFKQGITLGYFVVFFFFFNAASLVHQLIFYGSMIVILMLLYNLSSFISSMTAVFYFLCHLIASMITVNLALLVNRSLYDFRLIMDYHNWKLLLVFLFFFVIILKFYQLVMAIFKNIISINRRIERLLIGSNFLILAAIICYQRITFSVITSMIAHQIIDIQSQIYSKLYFLVSYLALTFLILVMIPLVNRLFIVDNNLENYKYRAEVDQMTGVLSREAGISHLRSEMMRSALKGTDLTVAYVDVNDLKAVNDKFGHKEGDKLIKAITDVIQSNLREFDIISRLGGDEFLIVFTKCSVLQAKKVWRRINDELLQVNLEGTYPFNISASSGFAQYNPNVHQNFNELLHEADEEMYHHKKAMKEAKAQ